MLLITQVNYLNKSETEVELEIRLIASPIKLDIVKISILEAFFILSWLSIVSVRINFALGICIPYSSFNYTHKNKAL